MAVAQNADGRLEVFASGGDGTLVHIWQTRPNGEWSDWESLGGHVLHPPAVARNLDGRLEVFAGKQEEQGQLYHIWQTRPNGPWSEWSLFGMPPKPDWRIQVGYTPIVAQNADGRLELFAGRQSEVWHRWQTRPSNGWSQWTLFASYAASPNTWPANCAVARNEDGTLEVFGVTRERKLQHRRQTAASNGWGDWEPLHLAPNGIATVERNSDGRLEIFCQTDGGIDFQWQTQPGGPWDPGTALEPRALGTIAAGHHFNGTLILFARERTGLGYGPILANQQTGPSRGPWKGWVSLGGEFIDGPCVGSNADGRLEIFAIDRNRHLQHRWQREPNGKWSDWETLGDWRVDNLGLGLNENFTTRR